MSTKQTTIILVLHENQTEKRVELTETPKRVKHLKMLRKKHFGLNITNCIYFIHFNGQKIPLIEDSMDLTQFYKQYDTVEIHIHACSNQLDSEVDEWEIVGGSSLLHSDLEPKRTLQNVEEPKKTLQNVEEPSDKKSSILNLVDVSMMSNCEQSIIYDDLLREKFTDFELEQVLNNARNETKTEMLLEQKIQQSEFNEQKKKLEKFYEDKILDSEKNIWVVTEELDNLQVSLTDTRTQLQDKTQKSAILETEIANLTEVQSKNEIMQEKIKDLKLQKHNVMKEREQQKNQLVGLNDTIEKMQKTISVLENEKQELVKLFDSLQVEVENTKASNQAKDCVIAEYEETIKKCKENLESNQAEFENRTKELIDELSITKKTLEDEKERIKVFMEKYDKEIEMYSKTCSEQVDALKQANKKVAELEDNLSDSIMESFDKERTIEQLKTDIEESKKLITDMTNQNNDYLKKIEELQNEKDSLNKRYEETDTSLKEFQIINEANVAFSENQKEEILALQELIKFRDLEQVQKISGQTADLENTRAMLDKITQDNNKLDQNKQELTYQIDKYICEIDDLQDVIGGLEDDKVEMRAACDMKEKDAKDKAESLEVELTTQTNEMKLNKTFMTEAANKIEELKDQLDNLTEEKNQKASMLEESFMHVDEFKAKEDEFEIKTQNLVIKLSKVNAELKASQIDKTELEFINAELKESNIDLNSKIETGENILNENQQAIENFVTEKLELQTQIFRMEVELEKTNDESNTKLEQQQKSVQTLEQQISDLNIKLKDSEEKFSKNDIIMQELKTKYEQELEEIQEKNLDSESDLSSNYEAREIELKKNFKNKIQEYKRENTLIEKKYNLYKDMYKKLKNEKLDIVQYGTNTDDKKILFMNPEFNTNNDALNLSALSDLQVPKEDKCNEIVNLQNEVQTLKTQIKDSEKQNADLITEFSEKEFNLMDQILQLTCDNDELKRESDNKQKSNQEQGEFQQKYNELSNEMVELGLKYHDLDNSRQQIVSNFAEITAKLESSEEQNLLLQQELDNKNSYYESLEKTNQEHLGTINSLNIQLTEAMLSYEENDSKLKTEHDKKIGDLTAQLENFKMNEGAFRKNDNNLIGEKKQNLEVRHEGIVCDACFKCPIYGNRYKSVMRQGFDLCEECNTRLEVKDPILKFTEKASFDREKLEEIMPSIKVLLQDIYEGKCAILFNNGFK